MWLGSPFHVTETSKRFLRVSAATWGGRRIRCGDRIFVAAWIEVAHPICSIMLEVENSDRPRRDVWRALMRGFGLRCPRCGRGALFKSYLKVSDTCPGCGEELHHHRADDAPPYFTILIVGHVVVGGVLFLERAVAPPGWVQAALWLPLTLILTLLLLWRVKGALSGLQWALYMHGFEAAADAAAVAATPEASSSS